MSDLVERLRGTYSTGPFGKRDFSRFTPAIQTEAADRIEALEGAFVALSRDAAVYYANPDDFRRTVAKTVQEALTTEPGS